MLVRLEGLGRVGWGHGEGVGRWGFGRPTCMLELRGPTFTWRHAFVHDQTHAGTRIARTCDAPVHTCITSRMGSAGR